MGILISDQAGISKVNIGKTSGCQLVDPGPKMGFEVRVFGTDGFFIGLKNFHKLKMPRTMHNTVGFAAGKGLFVSEEKLYLGMSLVQMFIVTGTYIVVYEIVQP